MWYIANTRICSQVGCCSSSRYSACSTYEHPQDLIVYILIWTVVLLPVPMKNPTHYWALLASCRNNTIHDDVKQDDSNTWSFFLRPQINPGDVT